MIGKRIKRILMIALALSLTMGLMVPAIAVEEDDPADVVYIDDGIIRVTVDKDMNIHVYRYDNGELTLMAGPVEKMGAAGATALTGAPWANDIPWSSTAGGLNANSAKLLSLKSGYVTTWSQGGTGTNADRLTHGNAQFEQIPIGGDDFVKTGSVFESGVETWIGKGNRLTVTAVNNTLNLTRKIVLEIADDLPGEVAYSTYYTYTGDEDSYYVTKFVENNLMIKEPVKPDRLTIDGYDRIHAGLWLLCGSPSLYGTDYILPLFYNMGTGNAPGFAYANSSWPGIGGNRNNARAAMISKNNWFWGADAGFPLNAFYGTTIGLSIGSLMPYNTYGLEMPVRGSGLGTNADERDYETAYTWMGWPGKSLLQDEETFIGASLLAVHNGDYYEGAGLYSKALGSLSAKAMVTSGFEASDVGLCKLPSADDLPEWSYAPSYETWGYGEGFLPANTMDLLPELIALGVTSVTLDAGWYDRTAANGEGVYLPLPSRWAPVVPKLAEYFNEAPLPCTTPEETVKVVARFIDYFHDNDIKVIAWLQQPVGRRNSQMFTEHPDWFARTSAGNPITSDGSNFYLLCTGNPEVLNEFTTYLNKLIFEDYGFDGVKGDSFWGMPPCYGADGKGNGHGHDGDIYANIKCYGKFFKIQYDKANQTRGATTTLGGPVVDREKVALMKNCMCGQPMSIYTWAGTNRPVPGDCIGSRLQRMLGKMYRGFYGSNFMVDTDHMFLAKVHNTSDGERYGPVDPVSYVGAGGALSTKYITQRFNPLNTAGSDMNRTFYMRYPGDFDYLSTTGGAEVHKWGEYVRWFGLHKDLAISSRDSHFQNLYKFGLDYPEAYAFKQGDDMMYSFYATRNDAESRAPTIGVTAAGDVMLDPWGPGYISANTYSGNVELRGLKPGVIYHITNVETGKQYEGAADIDGKITIPDVQFTTGVIYKASEIKTASLSGTVTNGGVIVPGADLMLLNADGSPIAGISPTAADLNGFYCFPIVPAGQYVINATANKGTDGLPYPGVALEDTYDFMSAPFRIGTGPHEASIDLAKEKVEAWTEGAIKVFLDKPVEYSIKLRANEVLPNANAFAVTVTVDNLSYKGDYEVLDGFTLLKAPVWKEQDDGTWKGTFMFYQTGQGINVDGDSVLLKLSFEAVDTGVASLTLDEVYLTTQEGRTSEVEKTFAFISALNRTVVTEIIDAPEFIAKYSIYDLDKDGVIDLTDISIALRAFLIDKDDDEWDEGISVDKLGKAITAALCDVNGDGVVDMLDISDILAHFGPAPPDMIDPRD